MKVFAGAALLGSVAVAGAWPSFSSTVRRDDAVTLPLASMAVAARTDAAQKVAVQYVTAAEGNKARYRVRERLVGKELDNDAVGETPSVTGSIALDANGKVIPTLSGFTAEVAGMKSDQDRRDGYVRRRLLVTDSFPTTVLKITEVRGLPKKLPTSGEAKFQLVGDLTVKGVTRPTTWNVTANIAGNQLTGTAATRFTFADFNLTQPRVPVLLSVADTIGLEYDFVMTKK